MVRSVILLWNWPGWIMFQDFKFYRKCATECFQWNVQSTDTYRTVAWSLGQSLLTSRPAREYKRRYYCAWCAVLCDYIIHLERVMWGDKPCEGMHTRVHVKLRPKSEEGMSLGFAIFANACQFIITFCLSSGMFANICDFIITLCLSSAIYANVCQFIITYGLSSAIFAKCLSI